jgi:hypothetical protein
MGMVSSVNLLWAKKTGSSLLDEKLLPQKPQILRGYLIRLTREYTDGGMDSHAEEGKIVTM